MTTTVEEAPVVEPVPQIEMRHEVVTLENLRTVSRARSLGFGIAVVLFALIEIGFFGFDTPRSLESTVLFGYNTSYAVPTLSWLREIVWGVVGVVLLAGGVSLLVLQRRRFRALSVLLIVVGAVLGAWPLALLLHFNVDGQLRSLTLPVAGAAWVLGGVTLVAGVLLVWRRYSRGAYPILFSATAVFLLMYLFWVARGSNTLSTPPLTLTEILWNTFIAATPLIFGSLSGLLCERSGVVNIAIEGQFMFGALGAAMVTSIVGAGMLGLLAGTAVAMVLGALLGAVLAWMALYFRANQILVGVLIVAFCTAMVQFMMSQVLDKFQSLNLGIGALPIAIPVVSRIPVVGPILFDQTYFVYLAVALVAVVNFMLFRTRWGLRTRSIGEKPRAAETVGLSVVRYRYAAVIIGGAVAGIGGAVFTIGQGIQMGVGLTANYGFIALAIMIFGRWRPWTALAAAMLFGFSITIDSTLNVYTTTAFVPQQFVQALPYLITIGAVAGLVGRVRAPAADGIPYSRE